MQHQLNILRNDPELRDRYLRYAALALPRHTSYPAVPFWKDRAPRDYRSALVSECPAQGWSLYVHVPFCESLCYFCCCTREILPKKSRRHWTEQVALFLRTVEAEALAVSATLTSPAKVEQLHLGGGTPNYLTSDQLVRLVVRLEELFDISPGAERSVEIDPRTCTQEQIACLRSLGFTRYSLGIQDFDPEVQRLVNRIQPVEQVARVLGQIRSAGAASVNFDLIYGLPGQTPESFCRTIEHTLAFRPDRIALYRLAVLPDMFRWQRAFGRDALPDSDTLLDMFLTAVQMFQAAGYSWIGLDHFALSQDALSQAYRSRRLRRTFQGITTGHGLSVLGFGPSAISILHDSYYQNRKTTSEWSEAIQNDGLATFRGVELSRDDLVRREVIEALYCYGHADVARLAERYGLDATVYFRRERSALEELAGEGIVTVREPFEVRLTFPLGRLLTRVVAAVFDHYLPPDAYRSGLAANVASRVG